MPAPSSDRPPRERPKVLRYVHAIAAAAAAVAVCAYSISFVPEADGVTRSVPGAGDAVALTFDDGPDPRFTPQILDILEDHGARATFFVLGTHAERHPELIARMTAEGHEVAHHTHTHPHVDRIGARELAWEMDSCLETLRAQGVEPVWYRPPRKQLTEAQEVAARRRGLRVALWSRCLERAVFQTAEEAATVLAGETQPGDIILAHDGLGDRTQTVAALPLYLSMMSERDIELVTLSELERRVAR